MQDSEIFRKCIDKWGTDKQLDMVVEELSELILAIQKWKRYHSEDTLINVAEEVVDVELMLGQLGVMMNEKSQFKNYYKLRANFEITKRERIIKRLEQ